MDNKMITFHTNIKKTATQQPIETTWCVFASDYNSVQVEFVVADLRPNEIRTVNPTIVLFMEDGSTVQRTKEQIVQKNNVFSYKLKDREGQHTGVVKAQLKLATVTGEAFQSNIYTFTILESLDSVPVPKEFVIDDIQNILQELKHHITHIFKDEETRKQVFADTIKNLMVNEKQREAWFNQSQQTRASLFQVFMDEAQDVLNDAQQVKDLFDELVETGIVESNIADKLSDLEVSYAPRLSTLEQNDVSLTAQLQHMEIEVFNEIPSTTQLKEGKFGFVIDVAQQQYDNLNLSFEMLNSATNFPLLFTSAPSGVGVKTVETHLSEIRSTDGTYRSVKVGQTGGVDGSSNYARLSTGNVIPVDGSKKIVKSDLTNFRFSVKPLSANCYDGSGFHMASAVVSFRGKNNEVLGDEVSNHFIYESFPIPPTAIGNKVVLDEWTVVKWDLQEACRRRGINFDFVDGIVITFNAYTNHSSASCEYLVDDISFEV